MAVQPRYLAYILEQLARLGTLRSNRMFGGVGLYCDGLFFAVIDDDTLFFKTDDSNVARYRARNMPRFMPMPHSPEVALGYHQVPADVIEDDEVLVEWARQSVAVALTLRAKKAQRVTRVKKPAATTKPRAGQAKRRTAGQPAKRTGARAKPRRK